MRNSNRAPVGVKGGLAQSNGNAAARAGMTASRCWAAAGSESEELVRHLIGGKKMMFLGYIAAATEPAAIEAVAALFGWP
jgi:hypothetical protein